MPDAYSKFKDPLAVAVSLPAGSALSSNVCGTAVLVPLLNTEAPNCKGWESSPAVAVAVPMAGKANVPRTVPAPSTSSVVAGAVVLMPILAVLPVPD